MSILDIRKTLMHKFWYDYIKPKYQGRSKLCYVEMAALLFILKLKVFMKILLMTFKNGLTHQTTAIMIIDHFQ